MTIWNKNFVILLFDIDKVSGNMDSYIEHWEKRDINDSHGDFE